MISTTQISSALKTVDWNSNVASFLSKCDETAKTLEVSATKIAHWAYQIEKVDKGNPALCFVREAQTSVQYAVSLIALGLYKPSAISSRALLENFMYYSFFREHREELNTLMRDESYYVTKAGILDYHKIHTPEFKTLSDSLGVKAQLEKWYSEVSGVVHGQIPGQLITATRLSETTFNEENAVAAADLFNRGVQISNLFLLATVGQKFWPNFSVTAKANIIKGLSGRQKNELKLDSA